MTVFEVQLVRQKVITQTKTVLVSASNREAAFRLVQERQEKLHNVEDWETVEQEESLEDVSVGLEKEDMTDTEKWQEVLLWE